MIYAIATVLLLVTLTNATASFNWDKYQPKYKPQCGAGGPNGPAKTQLVYDMDEDLSIEDFSKVVPSESFFRGIVGMNDEEILEEFQRVREWAEVDYGVTFGGTAFGANAKPACEVYKWDDFQISDDGKFTLHPFNSPYKTYTKVFDNRPDLSPQADEDSDAYGANVDEFDPYCAFVNDGGFMLTAQESGAVWNGEVGGGSPAPVGDLVVYGHYYFFEEREDPRNLDHAQPTDIVFKSYAPIRFITDLNFIAILCGVEHPTLGTGTANGIAQYYFNGGRVRTVVRNVLNLVPDDYEYIPSQ